jgi:DNA-binding response OmpR family regulator
MKEHLTAMQFNVITAFDYRSAVRALESRVPDVVCVDLELPIESGYELCEHIRRRAAVAHVPILVTSDRGFPENMAHAEEAGANAFLRKPFAVAKLTDYLENILGAPRSRPTLRLLRAV